MFTQVHEEFVEARQNYQLLFGQPAQRRTVNSKEGYTARTNFFAPGARFGLDLWFRNEFGTVRWWCFVCETVQPGESAERVPYVTPAVTVLLSTKGAAQSRLFLAWLAGIEEQGVHLCCRSLRLRYLPLPQSTEATRNLVAHGLEYRSQVVHARVALWREHAM